MEQTVDNTKKYLLYFGLAALIVIGIVVLLGRMEFHNELEREQLPHTLIGYLDDAYYVGDVTVLHEDWPDWTKTFDGYIETTLQFTSDGQGGRIGIFADLIYFENRYENRSWFSGKLLERASEYYYKPDGPLYLDQVYEQNDDTEVFAGRIVPQNYDFYAFDGKP